MVSCLMLELSQRLGGVLQMEKRGERACGDSDKYPRCRLVLQRALTHNLQNLPGAAKLCQAWGLLEVSLKGNLGISLRCHACMSSLRPLSDEPAVVLVAHPAIADGILLVQSCEARRIHHIEKASNATLLVTPAAPAGQHLGSGVPARTSVALRPTLRACPAVAPCAAGTSRSCRAAAAETGASPA